MAGCAACDTAHAAMLEASVCYRAWPSGPVHWKPSRRRRVEPPRGGAAPRARAGPRPCLMGIVNATPDSLRPGTHQTLARGSPERSRHRCSTAGARDHRHRRRTGVTNRPPVRCQRKRSPASCPLISAVPDRARARPSVRHLQAGRRAAAIEPARLDRQRRQRAAGAVPAEVCAGTGAALVLMHTRATPKQKLFDPTLDGRARHATSNSSCASGSIRRSSAAWRSSS